MERGTKNRISGQDFDPEFRFLLEIDPAFEPWRGLAAEWWSTQKVSHNKAYTLIIFFVRYLHALRLDKRPLTLFKTSTRLPDLWTTLELASLNEHTGKWRNDIISDLLDWVLRTHLAEPDEEGHRVVPKHLHNPFPRIQSKVTGKHSDLSFGHVTTLDPRMKCWQVFATEWLEQQKTAVSPRRDALDAFLVTYLIGCELPHHPILFLTRSTPKPIFSEVLAKAKTLDTSGQLGPHDIKANNYISNFLDWVLNEKFSFEDHRGHRIIPHELHNPVGRLTKSSIATPTETVRATLSIRYIKELRTMLAEGLSFRDWTWAQQVMEQGKNGGDWFQVDPELVNLDDPDCVWRERDTSYYEQKKLKLALRVTELWSPVRAMAVYLKLELPLRAFQVRMLDSGEADTWRYQHSVQGGHFVLNDSPLATRHSPLAAPRAPISAEFSIVARMNLERACSSTPTRQRIITRLNMPRAM